MKFFIDTANVDEIRKANDMGVIAGVTTNPSLIAKEHKDYAKTLAEIATIVDGPISGEVKATTTDAETMIKEGEAIYALDPKHMVVKIPMTVEGLKAIKALSAKGIPTNCTLIFSANQALLAARAGATSSAPSSDVLMTSASPVSISSSPSASSSATTRIFLPKLLRLLSVIPSISPTAHWPALTLPPCPTRLLSR